MVKFKFRTSIDSYTDASEFTVNSERIIKTNFTVTLRGYLIPEEFNNVVTTQKHLTPKRILMGDDVSVSLTNLVGSSDSKRCKDICKSRWWWWNKRFRKSGKYSFGGTGVSVGGAGLFDGRSAKSFTFDIGQDVATTSNVIFSSMQIGQNSFIISERARW